MPTGAIAKFRRGVGEEHALQEFVPFENEEDAEDTYADLVEHPEEEEEEEEAD